jgi:hypothetical protein
MLVKTACRDVLVNERLQTLDFLTGLAKPLFEATRAATERRRRLDLESRPAKDDPAWRTYRMLFDSADGAYAFLQEVDRDKAELLGGNTKIIGAEQDTDVDDLGRRITETQDLLGNSVNALVDRIRTLAEKINEAHEQPGCKIRAVDDTDTTSPRGEFEAVLRRSRRDAGTYEWVSD